MSGNCSICNPPSRQRKTKPGETQSLRKTVQHLFYPLTISLNSILLAGDIYKHHILQYVQAKLVQIQQFSPQDPGLPDPRQGSREPPCMQIWLHLTPTWGSKSCDPLSENSQLPIAVGPGVVFKVKMVL